MQYLRPNSTIRQGAWDNFPNALRQPHERVSRSVFIDGDEESSFLQIDAGSDALELGLPTPEAPTTREGIKVNVRAKMRGGPSTTTMTMALVEGATTIHSAQVTLNPGEGWREYELSVPLASANNITSFANLSVQLEKGPEAFTALKVNDIEAVFPSGYTDMGTRPDIGMRAPAMNVAMGSAAFPQSPVPPPVKWRLESTGATSYRVIDVEAGGLTDPAFQYEVYALPSVSGSPIDTSQNNGHPLADCYFRAQKYRNDGPQSIQIATGIDLSGIGQLFLGNERTSSGRCAYWGTQSNPVIPVKECALVGEDPNNRPTIGPIETARFMTSPAVISGEHDMWLWYLIVSADTGSTNRDKPLNSTLNKAWPPNQFTGSFQFHGVYVTGNDTYGTFAGHNFKMAARLGPGEWHYVTHFVTDAGEEHSYYIDPNWGELAGPGPNGESILDSVENLANSLNHPSHPANEGNQRTLIQIVERARNGLTQSDQMVCDMTGLPSDCDTNIQTPASGGFAHGAGWIIRNCIARRIAYNNNSSAISVWGSSGNDVLIENFQSLECHGGHVLLSHSAEHGIWAWDPSTGDKERFIGNYDGGPYPYPGEWFTMKRATIRNFIGTVAAPLNGSRGFTINGVQDVLFELPFALTSTGSAQIGVWGQPGGNGSELSQPFDVGILRVTDPLNVLGGTPLSAYSGWGGGTKIAYGTSSTTANPNQPGAGGALSNGQINALLNGTVTDWPPWEFREFAVDLNYDYLPASGIATVGGVAPPMTAPAMSVVIEPDDGLLIETGAPVGIARAARMEVSLGFPIHDQNLHPMTAPAMQVSIVGLGVSVGANTHPMTAPTQTVVAATIPLLAPVGIARAPRMQVAGPPVTTVMGANTHPMTAPVMSVAFPPAPQHGEINMLMQAPAMDVVASGIFDEPEDDGDEELQNLKAQTINPRVRQGETFRMIIPILDATDTAVTLVGYTAEGDVRLQTADNTPELVWEWTATVIAQSTGGSALDVRLAAATSAAIDSTKFEDVTLRTDLFVKKGDNRYLAATGAVSFRGSYTPIS